MRSSWAFPAIGLLAGLLVGRVAHPEEPRSGSPRAPEDIDVRDARLRKRFERVRA
jgi:hypothetical protein